MGRRTDAGKGLLTAREREVLELLASGLNGEEVAVTLDLSQETVRTHVRNSMRKLRAKTRVQAVVEAVRSREIDLDAFPSGSNPTIPGCRSPREAGPARPTQ